MKFECLLCYRKYGEAKLFNTPKGYLCVKCLKENAGITNDMIIKKMTIRYKLNMINECVDFKGTSKVKINIL